MSKGSRHGLDVWSSADLSTEKFTRCYLESNTPVIIKGCMDEWRSRREWVLTQTEQGGPPSELLHLKHLKDKFGTAEVPVVNSRTGEHSVMTLNEYLSWFTEKRRTDGVTMMNWTHDEILYLKDWHFAKAFPSYKAYSNPKYFEDDWLNDWFEGDADGVETLFHDLKNKERDYAFVYLGPEDSMTFLHTDVLKSHSWSGNIAGMKRWSLLPPKFSHLLEDSWGRCKFQTFDEAGIVQSCGGTKKEVVCQPHELSRTLGTPERETDLAAASEELIVVTQYPGEIIFVPSGWYHTVKNLTCCLSINHNWIDSSSLSASLKYLQREQELAIYLLEDCRSIISSEEFEQLVQRNILLNCGMNFKTFRIMVKWVLQHAIEETARADEEENKTGATFKTAATQERRKKYGPVILKQLRQ